MMNGSSVPQKHDPYSFKSTNTVDDQDFLTGRPKTETIKKFLSHIRQLTLQNAKTVPRQSLAGGTDKMSQGRHTGGLIEIQPHTGNRAGQILQRHETFKNML